MQKAPIPKNEKERLEALKKLQILDTPPEERFDRIAKTAQSFFDVPIALVTLVDANRQWFKTCIGLPIQETDRAISFCGHAIMQKEPFIIEDALQDVRFSDNPLVTGEPHIRFYAGMPISTPDGNNVGTLCVIDTKPRKLSDEQIDNLVRLASWAELEINSKNLNDIISSLHDALKKEKVMAKISEMTAQDAEKDVVMAGLVSEIGNYTQVSRVYVFEDSEDGTHTSNAYEWCNEGVKSQRESLQNFDYEIIPSFKKIIREKGIIFSDDIKKLPKDIYEILAPQKIISIIIFPILIHGKQVGFIGFDECLSNRVWKDSELLLLKTVSEISSGYLQRTKDRSELVQRTEEAEKMNRMMVERELKMVELKEKIKILEADKDKQT
jgi:GAF domain-containing protein